MSLQNLLKENNYNLYIGSANIANGLIIGAASNDVLSIYDQIFGTLSVTGFSTQVNLNYSAVITGKNVVIDLDIPGGTIGSTNTSLQFTLPTNIRPRETYYFPIITVVNGSNTSGVMIMATTGVCSIYPNINASTQFVASTPLCGLIGAISLSYILN